MGENDGRKVLFIGKEVAAMNVCEGDFVLSPLDLFGDNGSAGLNKLIVCEHTRKSVRAVVHIPAPKVVGIMYSRGVSRVKEACKYLSSTLRRAVHVYV